MKEKAVSDSTRVLSLQALKADSSKVDSTKGKSQISMSFCSAISLACGKWNLKSSLSIECIYPRLKK